MRNPYTCSFFLFLFCCSLLSANQGMLDFVGGRADRVENKRFEKKMWNRPEHSPLQKKSFPIEKWDKHFSPLGAKRAPIETKGSFGKERFETKLMERETVDFDMSRWNEKMVDLHERAGIETSEEARLASDHQLYNRMLGEARQYRNLGEKLSLRDINRYQFRNNRPDGDIPSRRAGSR
ncbi:MAG: hypothetical protein ACLFS1_10195 [Opitutales bacterium]